MSERKKKFRAEFRKNRTGKRRDNDFTRKHDAADDTVNDLPRGERLSGKGELTRKRTISGTDAEQAADAPLLPSSTHGQALRGRVLSVHGLISMVEGPDDRVLACAVRRLLKTVATDQRHVVAAGDWVSFLPIDEQEGVIERIEPRTGVLSRMSKGRRHIMVANVDQLLVLGSAAEPYLKPNLIDRFLISAEQVGLRPLIGINKIDLVDPAELQPLIGIYARMGYPIVPLSVKTGRGVAAVGELLAGRSTVIVGQSGVGKSSLLNAVDPDLQLRTGDVSGENQKGKHTTTAARLLRLSGGGYVVDTPGIRQFQLWDVVPAEVGGRYRDLRPFVNHCRFPDCTHTHESGCAVKDAVADGWLDSRRYDSYCAIRESDELQTEDWE